MNINSQVFMKDVDRCEHILTQRFLRKKTGVMWWEIHEIDEDRSPDLGVLSRMVERDSSAIG